MGLDFLIEEHAILQTTLKYEIFHHNLVMKCSYENIKIFMNAQKNPSRDLLGEEFCKLNIEIIHTI